jgi:hypothetical protein
MQHQQAAALDGGIHGAGDAVAALHPHLPQLALKRSDVGQPDALRPKVLQQFGDAHKAGLYIGGQSQLFRFGLLVLVYRPSAHIIAFLLFSHHGVHLAQLI